MKSEISVVIPTLDNFLDVKKVIFSIDSQDLLPSEIISQIRVHQAKLKITLQIFNYLSQFDI